MIYSSCHSEQSITLILYVFCSVAGLPPLSRVDSTLYGLEQDLEVGSASKVIGSRLIDTHDSLSINIQKISIIAF